MLEELEERLEELEERLKEKLEKLEKLKELVGKMELSPELYRGDEGFPDYVKCLVEDYLRGE